MELLRENIGRFVLGLTEIGKVVEEEFTIFLDRIHELDSNSILRIE